MSYFEVKDALVESTPGDAALYAQELVTHAEKKSGLTDVAVYAGEIAASENDIEEQRAAFERLSNAVYEAYQETTAGGITVYRQYCPMAFNDRGAYWLSDDEEILNPYYGSKMLNCGVVKETLEL